MGLHFGSLIIGLLLGWFLPKILGGVVSSKSA